MHCPFCGFEETQVKDSRMAEDGLAIRRRRACPDCGGRFTTFERIQLRDMTVLKSGDRKQSFDRDKIYRSMHIALRKRPVADEQINKAVNSIVRQLETGGESEIPASHIGDLVMHSLAQLDRVGYIRYASVYKDFEQPDDFKVFVRELNEMQVSKSAKE